MRKKYIRVEEINLVRLANAEFMNFMERFLSLLPLEAEGEPESGEMGAPKLSITAEQVTEAKGYLAQMNDLTRIPQMKAETKPKEEVDRKRDSLISLLFSRVKTSRSVPIEAESKAAEQLYIVISPYRGIGKLPYNQETEMIKGLLLDLRKLENSEAVRTLGLDAYVDELDNCNKQFEALVKTADMKNSELGFNEQMRDLRVAMTALYEPARRDGRVALLHVRSECPDPRRRIHLQTAVEQSEKERRRETSGRRRRFRPRVRPGG